MPEAQRLAAAVVGETLAGRSLTEVLGLGWRRHPRLSPQQRARIQDIAYGTLRHCGQLQAVLDQLLKKPPDDPRLHGLLLAALYQLQYGRTPAYAVVSCAVEATHAASKSLVNAVLRNFLRRRATLLAQAAEGEVGRYSHPQWWIDKLKSQHPADYRAILEEDNRHPPMALRVNRRATGKDAYLALLEKEGLSAQSVAESALLLSSPVPVGKLPGFADGLVSVQDAGAQLAAGFLDVRDGMRVLDACAAPGGKTSHILELADADLTALDCDAARLEQVRENLHRLRLQAYLQCADAARVEDWWDGEPFERILADVPCSASGVARRHPDIKWLRRESDIAQFARRQGRILDALWRTLARGGKLLYATCSVFHEENREQIAAFLERHGDAKIAPLAGAPAMQLLPEPSHDGFFYALLVKA